MENRRDMAAETAAEAADVNQAVEEVWSRDFGNAIR